MLGKKAHNLQHGRKLAQIECELGEGSAIIQTDFVASVQTPSVSTGRLLQKGWQLHPGECEAGVQL